MFFKNKWCVFLEAERTFLILIAESHEGKKDSYGRS